MFNKRGDYGVSVSQKETGDAMTAAIRSSNAKDKNHQVRNENLGFQYNRIFPAP